MNSHRNTLGNQGMLGWALGLLLLALPATLHAQFQYTNEGDTVTITRYTGPGGDVAIPSQINGLPVTRIGGEAFSGDTNLTSVTIPDSVTHIGDGAFYGCSGLTNVTIPDSVRIIGGSAFYYCTSLVAVTIGHGISVIEGGTFALCTGLTSVVIPDSVTNIGSRRIMGGHFVGAFQGCTSLTNVIIPNTVTNIGEGAFYQCLSLSSIAIPDSVTTIESGAFARCTGLTSIVIPHRVTSIGSLQTWWLEGAFEGCTGLNSVTIPDSVTSIGVGAFSICTSLTSVTIPDSVTNIGAAAFSACRSLTSVTIPDSVTNIGYRAFEGCDALTSVTIPNSVTSIGDYAFAYCRSLTSITIPYNVKSIDSGAFSMCSNLTSVRFEGNAPSIVNGEAFDGISATVYYDPRTAGWGETFGGLPTVPGDSELVFAGLTIRGEVGRVYSIQYVSDLIDSTESDWRFLQYVQLPASPYLWTDESAPATRVRFYRAVGMEPPTNMVFIPPGTFRMGSPPNEVGHEDIEGPQTDVIISRGFWMGKYEVTQGEYLAVVGNNPSVFTGDTNRPVESVSWYDATNYCAKLTDRERAAGRIAANAVYRLATEAEWEYACRGWTSTRFSYGDDPGYTNLAEYGWYGADSSRTTYPVGQKLPNPWGLYDMHGNVYEWCQDWWSDLLPGGIALDPQGPATGSDRVIRGGANYSWSGSNNRIECRSAFRQNFGPDFGQPDFGFRVVLAPGQP